MKEPVMALLPEALAALILRTVESEDGEGLEEVRLRVGQPILVKYRGREYACGGKVRQALLKEITARATEFSAYAYEEPLRNGWLPLPGGGRLGIASRLSGEGISDLAALCLRFPYRGDVWSDEEFHAVYPAGFRSTLVLSPPGGGKTTLLRALIRRFSAAGYTVGVADDRMEIASVRQGMPSFDLGPRTDVVSGGSKSRGAMMLLRSLAPDIIAFDEITAREDSEAAEHIAFLGVGLLSTAHAHSPADLERRALYKPLVEQGIYELAVVIHTEQGKRRYRVEAL